ncbi:MAG TPA: c-type cytochrome [Gammaproteobacteria bacterium]|nr:c-type cytochrome [Gammaproteobacteria bacterium]
MIRFFALCASALVAIAPAYAAAPPASAPAAASVTQNYKIPYPVAKVPPDASPALRREIKKGEYLTKISDCMACHTDHDQTSIEGKPFAGGLPITTPFGIIYSRNITPDTETGIGAWTFQQFDDAVRYGKSPQGYLFAAMPYNYYNAMSRADVLAIWEFLKRVPAVHAEDKPLDMMPPFSWRWLQFGWQFLFFRPAKDTFKPDRDHSAEWNRGRFIVEGPEHCGACHTAHNFLGGAAARFARTGSSITGMWAPNISAFATDPHSVQAITEVFTNARGLGGGTLAGPMLDAISNSMHFMTPADMRAVAIYLRSVKSELPPSVSQVPARDVDLKVGAQIYNGHCAACHASGVGGAPRVGNARDWAALEKTPMIILYENVWHGVSLMPPKGGCNDCTAKELSSAMTYMLQQSRTGTKASEAASAKTPVAASAGAPGNVVSLALGEKIYAAHCSACHASGVAGAPVYSNSADWAPRIAQGLDSLYQHATHGLGAMPPKGGCTDCTESQIESAVDYMVTGSGGKAEVQKALEQSQQQGSSP